MSVQARLNAFGGGRSATDQSRQSSGDSVDQQSSSDGSYRLLKLDDLTKRPLAISCHAWNKDGTLLAFSPMNHEIHIVKFAEGTLSPIEVLRAHEQKVTGIDWAPNSNRIVSCSEDRNAYVWTRESDGWKPTLVLLQFQRSATYVKWSNSEKKFAVASGAKCVAVCYYEEEHNWWVSKSVDGFESTVLTLTWHQSDCVLAAGSSDCSLQLFSAACKGVDKKPAPIFGPQVSLAKLGIKLCEIKSGAWVMDIAFSPDGGTLAYVTHDSCIHFVTVIPAGSAEGVLPTQEKVQTIRLSGLPHRRVLFLSKDAIVAAGHDSNPILYTRSADTWSEHSKLDDSKSKKQGASQSSARSAAFRKFEMAMPQGTGEGDSGPSGTLPTRHQVRRPPSGGHIAPYDSDGPGCKPVSYSSL
jgi:actin related protein 2/3 complex subunit 1A/1B